METGRQAQLGSVLSAYAWQGIFHALTCTRETPRPFSGLQCLFGPTVHITPKTLVLRQSHYVALAGLELTILYQASLKFTKTHLPLASSVLKLKVSPQPNISPTPAVQPKCTGVHGYRIICWRTGNLPAAISQEKMKSPSTANSS